MKWFRSLHALTKLLLSFGLLTLLNTMTGVLALDRLSKESGRVVTAYSSDFDGMAQVDSIASAKLGMARLNRDAILKIENKDAVAKDVAAFNAFAVSTQKNIDLSLNAFAGEEGDTQIQEIARLFPRYVDLSQRIMTRVQAGDLPGSLGALADVEPIAKILNTDTAQAAEAKHKRAKRVSALSQASFRSSRAVLISMLVACTLVGIGMSLWIGRMFSVPLGETVSLLREVAKGDLTGKLKFQTKDEVGEMARALNEALGRMRGTIGEVTEAAAGVTVASRELADGSNAIASGAQEQAASLEQTAASLEQITAAVRQSADNAREARGLAVSSGESAVDGGQIVSKAITAMKEINLASAKISDIISTIDEIAFQTNLLAVNAAVEAARAGEEGRGFAVVASEVRSLALRTTAAAKEVKNLIGDSLRKVERGSILVNDSGQTLQGIISSVQHVTRIVGQIALASEEQSTGIDQVSLAMSQIDQVTQSNSAQTEELAATANSLSEQSERLMKLVSKFTIHSQASTAISSRRPRRDLTVQPIHLDVVRN